MLLISSRDLVISVVFKTGTRIYSGLVVITLRDPATWEEDMGVSESLVAFPTQLRVLEIQTRLSPIGQRKISVVEQAAFHKISQALIIKVVPQERVKVHSNQVHIQQIKLRAPTIAISNSESKCQQIERKKDYNEK